MINVLDILAQATQKTTPTTTPTAPSSAALFLPAMLVAVMVFMILSSRSQRKREERKRKELHDSLTKNQRVLTIGGVVGTVVSVKDDQVVVKVDESTNTKMTFLKSAIQRVVTDDAPAVGDIKSV